ncbi:hypothetical protein CRT60_00280 [Azospirillum palustre]|uniref:Scaffolding protein n=1 Tax=Azospirillum palustre TaxID=2044885 RepID=A0A2B8BDM4_9PROT|nr:hypothetical protein [Azospirillum palustre]PGH59454.1 hypothetical protein CRT60_00280 [Azospirillum palustre]
MSDTPNGTGFSVDDAVASLLTGPADTQEASEAQSSAHVDGNSAPTEQEAPAATEQAGQTAREETTEESGQEEPASVEKVRFKLPDGRDVEATLEELSKSYLMQSDYTKKTQELATQRKTLEQTTETLRVERARELQILNLAQQMLAQQVPPEPDYTLASTDPTAFVQQKAAHEAAVQRLRALNAHQQRVAEQVQAGQVQSLQQHLTKEAEALVERIPEWKNPETAKTEKTKLIEFGRSVGFTDAELQSVYDSRAVSVMRDAMLYRELMAKRPAIEAKPAPASKVLQPGTARTGNSRSTEAARAHARLAQTGSVDDAAAALLVRKG